MRVNNIGNELFLGGKESISKQTKLPVNQYMFEKYVVRSNDELKQLHKWGLLEGAFLINGDTNHVEGHKAVLAAHKAGQYLEYIGNRFTNKREIDADLCHGMIAVGWDNSWSTKKNERNNRPLLAHSVFAGVKLNAVDYFDSPIKDIDYMVVYRPKDKFFRDEFIKNAKQSSENALKKGNESKFSWSNFLTCLFKKQIHDKPSKKAQKELAYIVTDLLLNRKLSKANEEDSRSLYCMEYAISILQASILTNELSEEDRHRLLHDGDKALSREEIAKSIYLRLKDKNNQSDSLSKAYWGSRICTQINPSGILSAYAAHLFDEMSEPKALRAFRPYPSPLIARF